MKTARKAPKKNAPSKPPTLAEIADALEITVRRVSQLRLEGMPVASVQDALRWRQAQAGDDDSAEELRRRRIGLLRQQERRAKLEADRSAGLLVLRSEVVENDIRMGSAMKVFLLRLENEIPFLCLGLPIEKSREICKREIRKIWEAFAAGSKEFWKDHPETSNKSKP